MEVFIPKRFAANQASPIAVDFLIVGIVLKIKLLDLIQFFFRATIFSHFFQSQVDKIESGISLSRLHGAGYIDQIFFFRTVRSLTLGAYTVSHRAFFADALQVTLRKHVAEGVNRLHDSSGAGFLLITHYTRILRYIKPDHVHVFVDGRVAEAGGPDLADRLEEEGYDRYLA